MLYTCGCYYTPDNLPVLTADPRRLTLSRTLLGICARHLPAHQPAAAPRSAPATATRRSASRAKSYLLDANLEPTSIVSGDGRRSGTAGMPSPTAPISNISRATRPDGLRLDRPRLQKRRVQRPRRDRIFPTWGSSPFDPETALTYEIGLRSEWLIAGCGSTRPCSIPSIRTSSCASDTLIDGIFTTLIENAATARIRGAEAEACRRPAEGPDARPPRYGHLDPKYLDVGRVRGLTLDSRLSKRAAQFILGRRAIMKCRSGPAVSSCTATSATARRSNSRSSPRSTTSRATACVGARIAFRPADDRWSAALFGTNLADKRYRTAGRGTLLEQSGVRLLQRRNAAPVGHRAHDWFLSWSGYSRPVNRAACPAPSGSS